MDLTPWNDIACWTLPIIVIESDKISNTCINFRAFITCLTRIQWGIFLCMIEIIIISALHDFDINNCYLQSYLLLYLEGKNKGIERWWAAMSFMFREKHFNHLWKIYQQTVKLLQRLVIPQSLWLCQHEDGQEL